MSLSVSVNFHDLLPVLQGPLDRLGQIEWIKELNQTTWLFAIVETVHLLSMVVLGGAVLVLNLRLLDAILTDVPKATVERATRPWLRAGIIGTIGTGIYMGVATVVTLLPSAAFFVKMVALIAAILLSTAVSRQVRAGETNHNGNAVRLAVAAIALWLVGLVLFALTTALSSGAFLVALAGFALFAAFLARYRVVYIGSLVAIIALTVAISLNSSTEAGNLPGVLAISLGLAVALVAGLFEVRRENGKQLGAGQLAALSSSLAWITVAAAGGWIGFS